MVKRRTSRQKGGQSFLNRILGRKPPQPQTPQSLGGRIVPLNQMTPGMGNWEVIGNRPTSENQRLRQLQANVNAVQLPQPIPGGRAPVVPSPVPNVPQVLTQNELEALLATPNPTVPQLRPGDPGYVGPVPLPSSPAPVRPTAPTMAPLIPLLRPGNAGYVGPVSLPSSPAPVAPVAPLIPGVPVVGPGQVPPLIPTAPAAPAPTDPVTVEKRNEILGNFITLFKPEGHVELADRDFANILYTLSYSTATKTNRTRFYNLPQHIPDFAGSAIQANIGREISRGSFGTIFEHATDPTKIIKRLRLDPANFNSAYEFFNSCLREAFIQFYLNGIEPDFIPAVYAMAKEDIAGADHFYIEMDYLAKPTYMNILDYFNDLNNRRRPITYEIFKSVLYNVCYILNRLETKTSFVHRDFKTNNIMINTQNWDIKVIDFGLATLRIPNPGYEDYIINNYLPVYQANAPVRFQQDVGMFIIIFREWYVDTGIVREPRLLRFIETLIPPSIRGLPGYMQAYNRNGTVFQLMNTEALSPRVVMNKILDYDRGIAAGTIAGGKRRRSTRRKSSTRRRRSHKK